MKRILVISDMHIPYHHQDSFAFLEAIKKEFKPTFTMSIGDLLDFHAISMHTHDPDLFSPGHELNASKEHIKRLESMFPKLIEIYFLLFLKCLYNPKLGIQNSSPNKHFFLIKELFFFKLDEINFFKSNL